jgi:hypothetical protein
MHGVVGHGAVASLEAATAAGAEDGSASVAANSAPWKIVIAAVPATPAVSPTSASCNGRRGGGSVSPWSDPGSLESESELESISGTGPGRVASAASASATMSSPTAITGSGRPVALTASERARQVANVPTVAPSAPATAPAGPATR